MGSELVSDYDDYLALTKAGFTAPKGAGRCHKCAFHIHTQGHRQGCPKMKGS